MTASTEDRNQAGGEPSKTATTLDNEIASSDDVSLGFLRKGLGFKLWLAQSTFRRDLAARLAAMDLTPRQCALLELVKSNPGISQATLGSMLRIDSSTMLAMIGRLEARGLLQRRRSAADRRRQELHMLKPGNLACRAAEVLVGEHESQFSGLFDSTEQTVLIELLSRIHSRG